MIAVLAGISAGLFSFFIINFLQGILNVLARTRYLRRFEDAFPDALTMMRNCLKAGLSLAQSLERVSSQHLSPVSDEFAQIIGQYRMGVRLEDALSKLAVKIDSRELELMVTSILVARRTGGNLAEVFERLSATIRERHRLQERVAVLTSQGRMQAVVVGLLPVVLGVVLFFLSPELIKPLFTTHIGQLMLVAAVILEVSGALLIRKIAKVDI